nr:hypothetical protein CFP56_51400 [Quercus suber]
MTYFLCYKSITVKEGHPHIFTVEYKFNLHVKFVELHYTLIGIADIKFQVHRTLWLFCLLDPEITERVQPKIINY